MVRQASSTNVGESVLITNKEENTVINVNNCNVTINVKIYTAIVKLLLLKFFYFSLNVYFIKSIQNLCFTC